MREMSIKTPKGNIFGMAAGPDDGPVVLGIHGFSQRNGWHTWEPMLAPLGAAGYRTISLDMPGWGKSPKWERTAGKSAIVAILDALDCEQATALMGKSWGGGVSFDFALNYPERVGHLILTAPAFRGKPADLERLTQPVLLAWAEDDEVIPISFGQTLVPHIPNCQFEIYPQGGHEAAQHNAADFAPKAVKFLKKI
ncbi:MAG: alpha/beta hydrolase [Chloroflexota bacterium]